MLDGFGEDNVPDLLHLGVVLVAFHEWMRKLALRIQHAAKGCERGVSAHADLAFKLWIPKVGEACLAVFHRSVLRVEGQCFRAPDAGEEQTLAIDRGHVASLTAYKASFPLVELDLAHVPSLNQAIFVVGLHPVNGRFDDVDCARLDSKLCLSKDRVVIRLFREVHLDAGCFRKRSKGVFEVVAGPAHIIELARGGECGAGNQRWCSNCTEAESCRAL